MQRMRGIQRTLFDGGFAGICFPTEYGGQGLPPAYQRAFDIECAGYAMPTLINVPTFVPCGAVLSRLRGRCCRARVNRCRMPA